MRVLLCLLGWLVPMPIFALGRLVNASSKLSHVRLIVPSSRDRLMRQRQFILAIMTLLSREVFKGREERRSKRVEREKINNAKENNRGIPSNIF